MPTYEYRCDNGHTFETFQSMSEDSLDACRVCDAPAERVLSAPAIHFKGSGFYTTDYARKGKEKAGSEGGSGSGGDGGSSKSEAKSESKSEAKSDGSSSSKSSEKPSSGNGGSSSSKSSD